MYNEAVTSCLWWGGMILFSELLHPHNPPNQEPQISRCLMVQIQIEILVWCEFVPRNLSFWIWWVSEVWHIIFSGGSDNEQFIWCGGYELAELYWFYVVLCHSMLLYVVLCCSMLFYVDWFYVVLCCSMLFYVVLCCSMLFYVDWFYVVSFTTRVCHVCVSK